MVLDRSIVIGLFNLKLPVERAPEASSLRDGTLFMRFVKTD